VNADGLPDLVAGADEKVSVLINRGSGTFAQAAYYGVGLHRHVWSMAVDDFVGRDGIPDIAVGTMKSFFYDNSSPGYLAVLPGLADGEGHATGRLGAPIFTEGTGELFSISPGDFDRDGRPDLGIATYGGKVSGYVNAGDGTFTMSSFLGMYGSGVAAADFTGDGKVDLAAPGEGMFAGNGDGTFSLTASQMPYVFRPSIADFNRDGLPDFVGRSGGVKVLLNTNRTTPATTSTLSGTVFNDANSDGGRDAAEGPVAGVQIYLDSNRNGRLDAGEVVTNADDAGWYQFDDVPEGAAVVRPVAVRGQRVTGPKRAVYQVKVSAGQNVSALDFGIRRARKGR